MSAFLGPIHFVMYAKIKDQERKIRDMVHLADERGWTRGLMDQVDAYKEGPDLGDLRDLVDMDNIHGWLSERVLATEARYLYTVHAILSEDYEKRLEELKEIERLYGEKAGSTMDENLSLDEAFSFLRDKTLDGMPCDGGIMPMDITWPKLVYKIDMKVHPGFSGNNMEEEFFLLREAWLEGFSKATDIEAKREDFNTFYLKFDS